jgi:hypothetical protein
VGDCVRERLSFERVELQSTFPVPSKRYGEIRVVGADYVGFVRLWWGIRWGLMLVTLRGN